MNPEPSFSRFYRALSVAAFVLGLAVVTWVASGFIGSSAFALGMTACIGLVYLGGAWELRRFGQTTAALSAALASVPQPLLQLSDWLPRVPSSLQGAVRQRIEGERSAFPSLALTPYLVGLLVMLGMLGTFLGMVVTFKGAVFALEGSTDLNTIRAALAAPIKGLGLSFGTSVAGVATSAMLGLMATLTRRERSQALRALDGLAATSLRPFSAAHQRQQSFAALQRQAEAMPAAAQHLQTLVEHMERRSQQLDQALLARQAEFQRDAAAAYHTLAQSVQQSLRESLAASARAATESLPPVVQRAMEGIAAESSRLHQGVHAAVQTQLEGLSARFSATSASVADTWTRALAQHEQGSQQLLQGLLAQTDGLMQARAASEAAWTEQHGQRMDQLATLWRSELSALRGEEAQRSEAAAARASDLQANLATQLATLGTALEAPMARLMLTASEAPKAAAEVIAQLRGQMQLLAERDNATLAERADLVGQISSLLQQVQHTTGAQRAAIENLVGSATTVLDRVGQQFADTVGAQADRAQAVAEQAATSAAQLANLGQAFQQGTTQLASSHEQLVHSLQRVESAIGQSLTRSDEQLAYYVAQAREVIDLSISAQQGIVEDLRSLRGAARISAKATPAPTTPATAAAAS